MIEIRERRTRGTRLLTRSREECTTSCPVPEGGSPSSALHHGRRHARDGSDGSDGGVEGGRRRERLHVHDEADQCVLGEGEGKGVEVRVGVAWGDATARRTGRTSRFFLLLSSLFIFPLILDCFIYTPSTSATHSPPLTSTLVITSLPPRVSRSLFFPSLDLDGHAP
jgi:hypothetical protein